ncbi:hypothetical protein WR164_05250 [Philodulcilactobacillus myokoensis]|uniref:DegV family protein n=1 Tax=Philodulcilactobacillus myokoensis TaxID=2929573 RepID=A0A9W6B0Y5_9LACO|nr:DegV family protein [Philodulcilactobacillus myokoensis]GLB46546.1 hypothetical protein WR164_05250 [Philodulcilactobacillus myokoensis]
MIQIVTDSSALITKEEQNKLPITVVPLSVTINQHTYHDSIDIDGKGLTKTIAENPKDPFPITSQPSIGAFVETYNRLTKNGDSVLSINMTDLLSGTVHSAEQAAKIADGNVQVINTKYIDQSLGHIVLEVAKKAQKGSSMKELVQLTHDLMQKSVLFIGASTLDNLVRGGRINRAVGLISKLMNLHVIFRLKPDELKLEMKGRGKKTFQRWFDRKFKSEVNGYHFNFLGISYTGSDQFPNELKEQLHNMYPEAEIKVLYTSAIVANHVGPNAFAIMGCYK